MTRGQDPNNRDDCLVSDLMVTSIPLYSLYLFYSSQKYTAVTNDNQEDFQLPQVLSVRIFSIRRIQIKRNRASLMKPPIDV